MKHFIETATDFLKSIYQKIAEMIGRRKPARHANARRGRQMQAHTAARRTSSPRRNHAKPGKTLLKKPQQLWNTISAFAIYLWRKITTWVKGADRRILCGIAGALVLVITLPIVLGVVLGGSSSEKEPTEDALSETIETEPVVAKTAAEISVVSAADEDAEAGVSAQADTDETSETSEDTEQEIDPYAVDAATVSLKYGDDHPLVASIQERLMELHYMDEDIPTEHFGSQTQTAVTYFQRKNGLTQDGSVGAETYQLLFSDATKTYSMSEGASGDDVKQLQNRLYELGYIESVTSYYGTDTQAAVKRFQELNGLTQDGSVGAQTLEILYSEDVQANYLQYGANNDTVKKCQQRLKKLGYLTTEADGNYGTDTVNAVKRFQERNGLIADGFLGASTKKLLMSSDALSNALVLGVRGTDVENIQQRLKELGYMKSVTGYYGEGTESAVIAFQKRNGLTADGKIGSQTMNKLFSDSAKKAKTSSGSSSSSSKPSSGSSSSGKPSSGSSSSGSSSSTDKVANQKDVASLISVAKSKLGAKYVKGAKGPNSFDCSGFVYWCLNQIGVKQSYMTSAGWASNNKYPKVTSLSKVQAGDIIAFKGHVGIALGGGKMIDASSGDGCVRITSLSLNYWKKNFKCAFRVL